MNLIQSILNAVPNVGPALTTLVVGSLLTYFLTRRKSKAEVRKTEAEAKKVEIDNAQAIINMFKESNEVLQSEVKSLRQEVQKLSHEVHALRKENELLRKGLADVPPLVPDIQSERTIR